MCINPEMCLYTPQRRQGQQDKEKSSKKIRNFGPMNTNWGENEIIWGVLGEGRVVRGDLGTWGQHRDKLIHPHPSAKELVGNLGQEFPSNFPILPFVLFPHHSSIISSNSAADWGLGATKN